MMINRLWRLAPVAMLTVVPMIARADEDENVPLSPQQLAAQRGTLGVIAIVVLLGVGFYFFRRWQTIRSGNTVDGGYGKDD